MTTQELRKATTEMHNRRVEALADIARTARMLIPVLKDKQMAEVARDLEAKLFLLDVVMQEMSEFATANLEDFMRSLPELLGGDKP